MKISRNWLKDFVEVKNYEELSEEINLKCQENAYYKLCDASNIVIGHVLTMIDHENADRLHVLTVDVKTEILQIVCGAPNVRAGQKVIISKVGAVLPLNFKIKKSKIRGIESFGMCCSLSELGIAEELHGEDGIHVLPNDAPIGEDALKYLGLDDEIIDLDLTPNRGDLLSIMGAAYDICAITNQKMKTKTVDFEETTEANPIKITLDTDKCMFYNARVIKNIVVRESPEWLKMRLMALGVRPINNVVDITNYVMLETGQPLHSFDYNLFGSNEIKVRLAKDKEEFETLDKQKRILSSDDIVITNGETPMCLGGVMGGLNSSINDQTVNVLLESAIFNPVSIRKTSQRLNLRSEASNRYEKGLDANRCVYALNLATKLLVEYANATVCKGVSSVCNLELSDKEIEISLEYLSKMIGMDVEKESVIKTYEGLGFKTVDKGESFLVSVPQRRNDITIKQDLVEEYVRLYGITNIPTTLSHQASVGGLKPYQYLKRNVINALTGLGINEVITYSLINEDNVYDYTIQSKGYVKVMSPLSVDHAIMRVTPLNGLVDVLSYNSNRKITDLSLFEISDIYTNEGQNRVVSMALTGNQARTYFKGEFEKVDFYYVKGIIEKFTRDSGKKLRFVSPEVTNENFNKYQTAYIYEEDKLVGFITKLHPRNAAKLGLKDVYLAEINIDVLAGKEDIKFEEISKYPAVERDIAVLVNLDTDASEVINAIKSESKSVLKSAVVFDVYTGDNIASNKKSIALKLTFASNDHTLEVSEVNEIMEKTMKKLNEMGVTLR